MRKGRVAKTVVEHVHHIDVTANAAGLVEITMRDECNRDMGTVGFDSPTAVEFAKAIMERAAEAAALKAGKPLLMT